MASLFSMPRHLIVAQGKVTEKKQQDYKIEGPKTINYIHSIRMLNGVCSHEKEIQDLKSQFAKALDIHYNKINELSELIKIKDQQIMDKEKEILKITMNQNLENKNMYQSIVENHDLKDSVIKQKFDSNEATIKSILFNPNQCFKIIQKNGDSILQDKQNNGQILKIKEQMKNTENALKNITNILHRPSKKYIFYNKNLECPETARESQKNLDETRNMISESCILQDYGIEDSILQIEGNSIRSDDTNEFMQTVLKEHIILKKTLVDLQENTKEELRTMKQYYQSQIRAYIELLDTQKEKNNKFKLHSTRINELLDNDQYYISPDNDLAESESIYQDEDIFNVT